MSVEKGMFLSMIYDQPSSSTNPITWMLKHVKYWLSWTFFHVYYRKYSAVRKWTLGLLGGKKQMAVVRASGCISRVRNPFNVSSSGIIAEHFIEKICSVKVIDDLLITICFT